MKKKEKRIMEAENAAIDLPLTTRYMYFDLIDVVH